MKIRFWHRHLEAEERAEQAEEQAEQAKQRAQEACAKDRLIESQWPEVRELARWARETRERNHLTELFRQSLGGGRV